MKYGLRLILILLWVGTAFGQVPNPTTITFNHSDFAITDHYVVGYFSTAGATLPSAEANFTKPTTCDPCSGPLPPVGLPYGTWYVAVRAVDGLGQTSVYSTPRIAFRLCTSKGRNHC